MHIRCSGLARPMVCAGYVFLDKPQVERDYTKADEGTAAGEYLERLLLGKQINESASNGVYIDDDMKFHVDPIHQDINERASTDVLCEQRIDWQTASGIWIKGQYDIAFVDKKGRLCIEDLKYGWGIVEVQDNWQLLGYAIGEVIRRGQAFNEIVLKIHQPRPHHEDGISREWVLTYTQLLEYKEKIEKRMHDLANGKKDLQTSDKCKYCECAGSACPAFNRLFYRSLEVTTEFFQDDINEDELSRQLDQIKRAEEVLKIKKDSITELGVARIKAGKIIPGYVQVQNFGNRGWNKNVSPEAIKMMTGKDIIEKKVMTPAKAEKLGVSKDLVKQLSAKVFTGMKLVKGDTTAMGNKIFGNTTPNGGN